MDPETSETTNRPVVVVPTSTIDARKEDPRYPGVIYGFPDDKFTSDDGAHEILKVTAALETAGITCCMVGTSALIYFGAARGRGVQTLSARPFERFLTDFIGLANLCANREARGCIAIPTVLANHYTPTQPPPGIEIESLLHTFPRFKRNSFMLWFRIVPSEDCHIECKPLNLERSKLGLPYPKLDVYTQGLLDTFNGVDFCDLVDGLNLSTEWGDDHLNLTGTNDVEWAKKKKREDKKERSGR